MVQIPLPTYLPKNVNEKLLLLFDATQMNPLNF